VTIETRNGAAGPRAALAGTGLDVWEVVETVRLVGNRLPPAARYLGIGEELVREALDHAAAHPGEVEAVAARQRATADADLRRSRGEPA
jgi:uncharacterized protein (DUF433 family)